MLRVARLCVLGLGLTVTALLSGCNTFSSADLRDNPTPELHSQTKSWEQYQNDRAIHQHHAWRTIHDDIARLFLYDKNTQLTPWPVP